MNNLGLSYHNLGDYEKAESLYREVLKVMKLLTVKIIKNDIKKYGNLAQLFNDIGEYDKAKELYNDVLSERKNTRRQSS